jgi:predicted enzyme related to lactoylglutathione lyase
MAITNQIVWCDIPVNDLDRAIKFYSAVLGQTVTKQSMHDLSFGLLPHEDGAVGGCLCVGEGHTPSSTGPLIYLNCDERLDLAVAVVEENGGKVLEPKHQIGPFGFRAVVLDSEGNRLGLHSK